MAALTQADILARWKCGELTREQCAEWFAIRRKTRRKILDLVRRGRLTREQADEWAAKRGEARFETRPDLSQFDPMAEPEWTLAMVTAWIIWRKPEQVRDYWDSYRRECRVWERLDEIRSDGELPYVLPVSSFGVRLTAHSGAATELIVAPAEARKELWRALQSGQLIASGRRVNEAKIVTIPKIEWRSLTNDDDRWSDGVFCNGANTPNYVAVRVPSEVAIAIWTPMDESQTTTGEAAPEGARLVVVQNDADIRAMIFIVYRAAESQNCAIPNDRKMVRFVNEIFLRQGRTANSTRIEYVANKARDEHSVPGSRYFKFFCEPGKTPSRKGLKRADELEV